MSGGFLPRWGQRSTFCPLGHWSIQVRRGGSSEGFMYTRMQVYMMLTEITPQLQGKRSGQELILRIWSSKSIPGFLCLTVIRARYIASIVDETIGILGVELI